MRALRAQERVLLKHLIRVGGIECPTEEWLDRVVVEDLDDGGMGSYMMVEPTNKGFSRLLSEAEFNDVDGTKVLASLYVDADNAPYEVGIWKVDFSPLISLPNFDEEIPAATDRT